MARAMLVGARMTERTPLFDTEEIELLFSEAETDRQRRRPPSYPERSRRSLPRGVEVANVDADIAVAMLARAGDDELEWSSSSSRASTTRLSRSTPRVTRCESVNQRLPTRG